MNSRLVIATALNDNVRIYLADTKQMVETARKKHDLYPTSCAALGRTLSVTSLMASMLKGEDETVTVEINGYGPLGSIICVGSSNGNVKGFVSNPSFYETYPNSHKLAVGVGVGTDGYLKVTKNLNMKQNYTSQVQLQTGEIGDDFAYYFSVSEQRPTITSVGVLVDVDYSVKSAGALIIEVLPGASEEDIVYLENLAKTLKPISSTLLEDNDLEKYISTLFTDARILEKQEIFFECDCSKERLLRNLLTLPKKDLEEIVADGHFEIRCEFCNTTYSFDEKDISTLMKYVRY